MADIAHGKKGADMAIASAETPPVSWRPFAEDAAGADALRRRIMDKLLHNVGKPPTAASERDWFVATALAVRDAVVGPWLDSTRRAAETGAKQVHYLSLEFLTGRLLSDAMGNLGLTGAVQEALAAVGVDAERLQEQEPDPALGNGGLGRLAACFMESMATLGIPAVGYGIRYEHGLFRQAFEDGEQIELPDDWLALGNPWEFARPEVAYTVGFGGEVRISEDAEGRARRVWEPAETLSAVAYDMPVIGGGGRHAATLRLWSARAGSPLHLEEFNRGDHVGALRDRVRLEAISRVLYPGDESPEGRELRLRQQFFFVTASLQDMLHRHLGLFGDARTLPDKAAVQLNDTHPALAVAELMRLLVDVHGMGWDEAWRTTVATVSYTNHTLMPEALETWPVPLMERLLPRHMEIIYRLNATHLEQVRERGLGDDAALAAASLIDEGHGRRVRMGHLAFVGSHAVNGVSALHTGLLGKTVFGDLDAVYPGRISNKTNGVTFRRWLHRANPGLTRLLVDALGPHVLRDGEALAGLAKHADDRGFQAAFAAQRRARKEALARFIADRAGVAVDPEALLDVQVKRIHEYKRQLLNILHAVATWHAVRDEPGRDWVPRVKLLAGKAAPGYRMAKHIIRLAHDVARTVNADPAVAGRLKLVFPPNYGVSLAELIIPAADLSEQISTAGMEASGTGNMKLALNGALTIGTLDGANVEIRQRVGAENFFLFGLTTEEVEARRARGLAAHDAVSASPTLARVLEDVGSGAFSPGDPHRYRGLVDALVERDPFMVAVDFDGYCAQQEAVDALWRDPARWWRMAVMNTAGVGWFSSDRTVAEYAAGIWRVPAGGA
ncbi:glycogen/starch/alpha-glucan phosphorylase [Craurococcus roseus]|uniref:Alpha-1,4 glucan phosphorylase n=1 Tax=Craurococcus roseus TaxID=77585 RepID=A0ABN1FMW1_9PROT